MQNLEFRLEHFEGPMDLLMHLLEKNKIDVYNIPIFELTNQYLSYLKEAESMNLEIASHFLLMAAQLIRIKTKMLLPKQRINEEESDPRQELIDQIVAYQFFKELSQNLEDAFVRASKVHIRQIDVKRMMQQYQKPATLCGLQADMLLQAFELLEKRFEESQAYLTLEKQEWTIEQQQEKLITFCQNNMVPTFEALLHQCQNINEAFVYFMALLESIREKKVYVKQDQLFGSIRLYLEAV